LETPNLRKEKDFKHAKGLKNQAVDKEEGRRRGDGEIIWGGEEAKLQGGPEKGIWNFRGRQLTLQGGKSQEVSRELMVGKVKQWGSL